MVTRVFILAVYTSELSLGLALTAQEAQDGHSSGDG